MLSSCYLLAAGVCNESLDPEGYLQTKQVKEGQTKEAFIISEGFKLKSLTVDGKMQVLLWEVQFPRERIPWLKIYLKNDEIKDLENKIISESK